MTLNQALAAFFEWKGLKSKPRTINGYIRDLAAFCIFLRDLETPVESITLETCIEWLSLSRALGYDENTIQKKAIAIKLFFDYLERKGMKVVPSDLIPIPKREFRFPRVADEEQYQKLLAVIRETGKMGKPLIWEVRNKAIIMLLWDTGARNGEIASLGVDDIDLVRMAARIKTEKSRGTVPFREIFWREETNEVLKRWLKHREDFARAVDLVDKDHIFVGIKGGSPTNYLKGRRLQVNYVSEILRKYSNKAKLSVPLNPHSCRHHMGRELARNGVNAFGISSLLGHVQVQSSFPYTMLFGKEREDLYRKQFGIRARNVH